jgi:hypothetical protein
MMLAKPILSPGRSRPSQSCIELPQRADLCRSCSASGSGSESNVVSARSVSVVCISSRTGAPPSVCILSTTRHAAAAQTAYCHLARREREWRGKESKAYGQARELNGGGSTWKRMPFR